MQSVKSINRPASQKDIQFKLDDWVAQLVAMARRTGSDGSVQSWVGQGSGQESIAAEREVLRGRKTLGSQTNTTCPKGSGSEAVTTTPAELRHRLQLSMAGAGGCVWRSMLVGCQVSWILCRASCRIAGVSSRRLSVCLSVSEV